MQTLHDSQMCLEVGLDFELPVAVDIREAVERFDMVNHFGIDPVNCAVDITVSLAQSFAVEEWLVMKNSVAQLTDCVVVGMDGNPLACTLGRPRKGLSQCCLPQRLSEASVVVTGEKRYPETEV